MAVCQNLVPLVNIKIAGKWMFIPLKIVLIGIDPYPSGKWNCESNTRWKVADNPIAIPHGRLWDRTVVDVVAVGGVVSVAVAVAELV